MRPTNIRVLYTDHSVDRGGAEIALLRILKTSTPWISKVVVPNRNGDLGVFAELAKTGMILEAGQPRTAGLTSASNIVGLMRPLISLVSQAMAIRREAKRMGATVLHSNSSGAAPATMLAAVGLGRRRIVHLRDTVDVATLGRFGFAALKLSLKRADAVVANSEYTLNTAVPYLRRTAISRVIPSPVLAGTHTTAYEPSTDRVVVGMIGRLDPWKGQELVLKAMIPLLEEFPELELVFVGSAEFEHTGHEANLREIVASSPAVGRVSFLGFRDDVERLVSGWDVCVHASTRPEPMGQVVLQYLTAARASVVADQGGHLQWARDEDNVLLFRMGESQSLRDQLRRLIGDPSLRRRLALAAGRTKGIPSPEVTVELLLKLYREVLGELP